MARLDELLARNLGTSKTAARKILAEGRVQTADGAVIDDGRGVISGDAAAPPTVLVDGAPLALAERALVLLHKPLGVVTALRDARHETAYALLSGAPLFPELRPVGRLDLDTSGLLLWTTEGALIQRLTHPKRRVPRTYQAVLARPFTPPPPDLVLEDGHRPEIVALEPLAPADAHAALVMPVGDGGVGGGGGTRGGAGHGDAAPLGTEAPPTLATITVVGGAYHEVRRIFAALGSHVLALCRTRFGDYALPPELPAGQWRLLPF